MKQYLLARTLVATLGIATLSCTARTQELASGDTRTIPSVTVEAQPLGANIERLDQALEYLGAPLPADLRTGVRRAIRARSAKTLQELLDPRVLLCVQINPEAEAGEAGEAEGEMAMAGSRSSRGGSSRGGTNRSASRGRKR